jgi:hypothetical protein
MSDLSNKASEFTIENFKAAMNEIYSKTPNNENIKIANEYLCRFEKSNEAWDISLEILNTPNLADTLYFNASQIMFKKLRFDFGNYTGNKDILERLGNILIEKIIQFKEHESYLMTNLCKCFALFIVFAHAQLPNIIKQLVAVLNRDNIRSIMALLIIFTFAAENVVNEDIVIDQNYKNSFELFLLSLAEEVMMFLNNTVLFINSYKGELVDVTKINKLLIECLTSWIQLGISPDILGKLSNEYSNLLEFVFVIDVKSMETYSDCICLLLRMPLQTNQVTDLSLVILNKVISFRDR